jgi:ribose transport system ATP-binding protein
VTQTADAGVPPPPGGAGLPPETPLLEVSGLTKSFMGQRALSSFALEIAAGEIRGLAGHNGSGKSTFIKLLAGVYHPDAGEVRVSGAPLRPGDPDAARRAGLRFIHQDLGLVDSLTVLENLKLGTEAWTTGLGARISWRRERRAARALFGRFGVRIDPDATVGDLAPVARTQLAVVRALQDEADARLVVLDEPTATLPDAEVKELFGLIRRVSENGVGVLYVSHRLEELFEICRAITVLRDGVVVGEAGSGEMGMDGLVGLIVGTGDADLAVASAAHDAPRGPVRLEAHGLGGGALRSLDLAVHEGEVVGLAGLEGSGVHEFSDILAGRRGAERGGVSVAGRRLGRLGAGRVKEAGVAVLPAARRLKGIDTMSVRENLTLTDLSGAWYRGWFHHKAEKAIAARLIEEYDIRPAETERDLETLSGGNRQKVCVAKWIRTRPSIFVVDEPTAGVDVGGRAQILALLREAADGGMSVVIASSDLEDLDEVCDRVVVLRGGEVATELTGGAVNRKNITIECYRSDDVADD